MIQASSGNGIAGSHHQVEWGLDALELLHNYSTSTCYTLANQPAMQSFMKLTVPRIGFRYNIILHLIMSISAMHLAHPERQENERLRYISQAEHHYSKALAQATAQLSQINEDNCHALYLFATLSSWHHLACGPRQGDFLLFHNGDGGHKVAEWLVYFRSLKPILEAQSDALRNGILAPIFQVGIQIYHETTSQTYENERIAELRKDVTMVANQRGTAVEDADQADNTLSTLLTAVDSFSASFSVRYDPVTGMKREHNFHGVGLWLYYLSDEFILLLQQRQPGALAIMAYFCVLLNDFRPIWMMEGWVDHLLSGIYRMMPEGCRGLLNWPIEEIGWMPP